MTAPPPIIPAQHLILPSHEGWRGEDVLPWELVDDDFIERDPDSIRISPDEPLTAPRIQHGLTASPALTFDQLVFIARRVGVEVVLAPSSHRGDIGRMGTVLGCTRHHTGTPNSFRPTEDYPDYNVVKEGRPGLWNSLSAFGLGRHRAIYVFSEDVSWHCGTWLWNGITDGNGHFLGIEAAGIGDWTPFQRLVYPRLCASILEFIHQDLSWMPLHLQGAMPRGRKSDAANIWPTFDNEVAQFLAHPEQISVSWKPGPTPVEQKELQDMGIVWVKVNDRVEIPHMIAGDRYFALKSVDEARQWERGGVPSVHVGNDSHVRYATTLTSEAPARPLTVEDAPKGEPRG
jgi:hypothetical protein